MQRALIYVLLALLPAQLLAGDFDGVKKLVERRVPWLSKNVKFQKAPVTGNNEYFSLQTKNGKLAITASSANAAAVGVNWYLRYYCHRSMSHMGDNMSPVKSLPVINEPVEVNSAAIYRFALNYCTYNYTMSFYTWKDWEKELDWMALNGVNLMLIANGSEAVWQNTLRRMGYTEKEIQDFITGPAYNAWWLMGNIQKWGGPMPQSQIDSRKKTVQKMLARMKELGIEPVMPGFYGMVPSDLKNKTKAHIIAQGTWGAFIRPDILDPTDTAFARIAGIFYDETKKLYGSDIRFFSGDPFHEGGKTEGVDLGQAGKAIQTTMQKHFPGSIWVLQGWQDNPKKGLLESLDKSSVLVQELFGENTNNWETREGYEGTPFIWATVTNFGERPGINGKLQRFADEVHRANTGEFSQHMKGVGIIPEGIINNPAAYELLLELGWHKEKVDAGQWINNYIVARYGKENEDVKQAWKLFLETVYSSELGYQEGPPENILCARPALKIKSVSSWGTITKKYDIAKFKEGVKLFAKALPQLEDNQPYKIDLIHFVRQVLANEADTVFAQFVNAYETKNPAAYDKAVLRFLDLSVITNNLLSHDPVFRLSTYQKQALEAGNTETEKKNNLHNLMMLVTYWGENVRTEDYLHDYAYKEWSGMMSSYYTTRWQMYFEYLRNQMNGQQVEAPDYFGWERKWVEENCRVFNDSPVGSLENWVKEGLK